MTFNNKVDTRLQLAEPGDYSGTFGLSAPQLEDGTLGIGSNGVVSWSPDADCGRDLRGHGNLLLQRGLADEGPPAYH